MARRYGSDLIVDVIKSLGIEYVAINPGSSFRGIHDSLVNYNNNKNPEIILCCHEEIAVAVAHGYAKAAGKPMAAIVHNVVGLQHASMAIYNAWCDKTPIVVMGGTGPMDTSKRRPWIDWIHTAMLQGGLVRDFVKWDDQPMGIGAIPNSIVRGYRTAVTEPKGPVYLCFDVDLQEAELKEDITVPDLQRHRPPAPLQAGTDALKEAALLLSQAEQPLIIADYMGRNPDSLKYLVELADLLSIPVIDRGARHNFPNIHPCDLSGREKEMVGKADVILGLDVMDLYGALVRHDLKTKSSRSAMAPGCKVIHVSLADLAIRSWTTEVMELAPIDLPILADTRAFLPALTEEIRRQGKFSKSAVEGRRKELSKQHDEIRAESQAELKRRWDESPISPPRMSHEIWQAIKGEDWTLVTGSFRGWPRRLWDWEKPGAFLGGYGGGGLGYSPGASVGAALALKDSGTVCINLQRDGDLLFTNSALWTASSYNIPLLIIMTNNRTYYNDEEHQERVAITRGRPVENKGIGMRMEVPPVDFATLAKSFNIYSEGPIEDPAKIQAAVTRALKVVKQDRRPALLDVIIQAI
ncbi:MAG: thiamine pyrophosphate-binding protein [Candidatus Binatia bacterium]|jgi:thiamine pyrophosphate-dependent acetolactate synthase large subunit-like protein|nr:thiamine pyrophosphate-binding protein [Candidatus Binatia bacterium]